ncbi:hypothetical protein JJ691_10640 [Kutzneria sp. CA-103260]|nr:hypothetical protein JJ691_10640 [Kutzneria sp. CA-103260]
MPSVITLRGENGRIVLDFSQAQFRSIAVVVDAELKSVRLKILVPEDAAVDLTQLGSTY